jgi:hypothetical protein
MGRAGRRTGRGRRPSWVAAAVTPAFAAVEVLSSSGDRRSAAGHNGQFMSEKSEVTPSRALNEASAPHAAARGRCASRGIVPAAGRGVARCRARCVRAHLPDPQRCLHPAPLRLYPAFGIRRSAFELAANGEQQLVRAKWLRTQLSVGGRRSEQAMKPEQEAEALAIERAGGRVIAKESHVAE